MLGSISVFMLLTALVAMLMVTSPTVVAVRVQDTTLLQHAKLARAVEVVTSMGVDSAFVTRLATEPLTTFNDELVKINVTNYATKPNYAHNYDAASVKRVRAFLEEHDSLLRVCERAYDVPREVVASIIWIETKYGKVLGRYHLPSVYLSVVLATEPEYIQRNVDAVTAGQTLDSAGVDSVRSLIAAKAARKVAWAVEQLKAMYTLDSAKRLDVSALRGSWAGAFGLPQFLPSSYQQWAKDGDGDGRADLFSIADAVHSVANYLRSNGWTDATEGQRAAIHHYNNSDAYVNAVLTLARKVR